LANSTAQFGQLALLTVGTERKKSARGAWLIKGTTKLGEANKPPSSKYDERSLSPE